MSFEALRLENQLCFPLYAAAKGVVRLYTPALAPLHLTYTQYIVMMVVWEKEEVVVKELVELLYLDTGTLTPLLKKLESKKYVTLTRDPEDRRSVRVRLTPTGAALRERAADIPAKIGACVPLTPQDAQTLYLLLHKILGGLDAPCAVPQNEGNRQQP